MLDGRLALWPQFIKYNITAHSTPHTHTFAHIHTIWNNMVVANNNQLWCWVFSLFCWLGHSVYLHFFSTLWNVFVCMCSSLSASICECVCVCRWFDVLNVHFSLLFLVLRRTFLWFTAFKRIHTHSYIKCELVAKRPNEICAASGMTCCK